jgi:hypothetical protein
MITFLRRIRRNLLAENKFTRYFIYASGEVILIVVGILIALAINNWNQREAAKKREQFYLEGLREEFLLSKAKLQELMKVNRLSYEEGRKLADVISSDSITLSEEELSAIIFHAFSYEINYNPNNSLLMEIISSGGLKDLADAELRLYLTSWESAIRQVHQQEISLRNQREHTLSIFSNGGGSVRTIFDHTGISTSELGLKTKGDGRGNMDIIMTRAFENNLLMYTLTGVTTESSHYKPLLARIDKILALLDKNIASE